MGIVVDIGCGSYCRGDVCIDLNPFDTRITPHLDRFVGFSRNPDGMYIVADAHMLPLRSGIASYVLAIHVIEHCDHPAKVLREAMRILEPSGTIIVEVPNPRKNPADWVDRTHIYSWTIASLENMLRYIGFDDVLCTTVHHDDDVQCRARKYG